MKTPLTSGFFDTALALARKAAEWGEVPVGALIVGPDGAVLAQAHNEVETRCDATAHAELLAIRAALTQKGNKYLEGCTLYVTLEPCPMCAGAIAHARLSKLVFGAYDPKSGGVEHGPRVLAHTHHKPEIVGGVMESECAALLKDFFAQKR
jgi:tRNA(adenine34) deaminase